MGHIWSIESLLDLLLIPQGLSTVIIKFINLFEFFSQNKLSVGISGMIMILAGVVSGFLASFILIKPFFSHKKMQDILIKILMTISMLSLILLCVFIRENLAFVNFLLGMLGI